MSSLKIKWLFQLLFVMMMLGCKSGPYERLNDSLKEYLEKSGEYGVIQVRKMASEGDTSLVTYNIRLLLQKEIHDDIDVFEGERSVFYIKNSIPIEPVFIEPIANGLKNSKEYIVGFKASSLYAKEELQLVFNDDKIYQKDIILSLLK